jgi:hypothetical protein
MKITELRIGNWVKKGKRQFQIGNLIGYAICNIKENSINCCEIKKIKPIKLTDEWLDKFSFIDKKIKLGYGEELELDLDGNHYNIFYTKYEETILMCREIKYVHQLQNLYHAFTNLELIIHACKCKKCGKVMETQ